MCGLDHSRVIGEPEVIVCTEVDNFGSIAVAEHSDGALLWAGKHAFLLEQALFLKCVSLGG
jgi:hypothetical protein